MRRKRSRLEQRARQRLGHGLKIIRVEDGLLFEHRNATHFLAEIDLRASKISVPVTAEFIDHPEYTEDEIVEHAMELLEPRLHTYHERGYRIREIEYQPANPGERHPETKVPVFIAFVERQLQSEEDLFEELHWLLEQLPER